LFDRLRELGLSQQVIDPMTLIKVPGSKLEYYVLGQKVCYPAYASLHGVGRTPRLSSIRDAIFKGAKSSPVDVRYLESVKQESKVSPKAGEVFSYIQTLYDSVAETMPEDDVGPGCATIESDDEYNHPQVDQAPRRFDEPVKDRKHLPPGSVYEQWRQFRELGGDAGFRLFWNVWQKEWWDVLVFRSLSQHSVCPVCIKHKLLIRALGHDLQSRMKQRMLYDRHLRSQYLDRRQYWWLRAQSRLITPFIVIILDGMDQAKFAWPRAPFFFGHDFDGFQRPRLHITGIIVHGFFSMITISHADISKSSSTTVDLVAHLLTILKDQMNIDVSSCHVHIQLDNTASTNKNNALLMFMGLMVVAGLVKTFTANFLRVGHTHEAS
jgi:hypothetical protein